MEADAKMTSPRLIFIQHFIFLSPTPAIQIYSHLKLQVSGFKAEQTSVRVNYGASGQRGELGIRVWVCARSGFKGRREETAEVSAEVVTFLESLEASGTNTNSV